MGRITSVSKNLEASLTEILRRIFEKKTPNQNDRHSKAIVVEPFGDENVIFYHVRKPKNLLANCC